MRSGFTFSIIITLISCAPALAYDWATNPGDGSPENPYQISTAEQLTLIDANSVLSASSFLLINDIDLAQVMPSNGWFSNSIIAARNKSGDVIPFTGNFDGNGFTIYNLAIKNRYSIPIGLFGQIGIFLQESTHATIKNLTVMNCTIHATDINSRVGAICGVNFYGAISNCSSSGAIEAMSWTGGICGKNYGTIKNCFSDTILVGGHYYVGGICGENEDGYIENCYAHGSVDSLSDSGGICGINWGGELNRCYSTCLIQGGWRQGGVCAYNVGKITRCYWDMQVSGITYDGETFSSPPATGLTTAQMKQRSSFVDWDFVAESVNGENEIWRMCTDGVDYPRLSWEFAQNGDFACDDGVDIFDLQALAQNWLTTVDSTPATFNYACDANGDDQINLEDYAVLGENW